jgi:ATP-binding cassette subfamily B protein
MVAGAFLVAPSLIALQIVGVVPIVLAESYFAKRRYSLSRERTSTRRMLDYLLLLGTSSATVKEIKLFGLHKLLKDRYAAKSETYLSEDAALSATQNKIGALLVVGSTAVYYGAYCVLIFRTASGLLTIGRLIFLAGILQRSKAQLAGLFSGFTRTSDQLMYLNDIFEFFDQQPRMKTSSHVLPVPSPMKKGIEFRNVSFAYNGSQESALVNVSFRMAPGERIALVGENGAGKTTIIKLLTRLYDPSKGQILLDGIDLREFNPEELRRNITAVFQDFVRYDLAVAENIGFGDTAALRDQDRIIDAAQRALARDFVESLPAKYAQVVGRRFEEGLDLSGGQWQKLALARTCMREAQVVILDEPTAAIDARAEYQLFKNFHDMVLGKTALLISHRFSTVRIADRILVLEKGRLREQGSHDELVHAGGVYAQLFEMQASGYR